MKNVIMYSTDCPKCKVLSELLSKHNISCKKITDVDLMVKQGFTAVPMLSVNGEIMDFSQAVNWIRNKNI